MGHLGEGKVLTTINNEKIVLTDDKGQNFTIEISNLGEIIKRDVIRKSHSDSIIDCDTIKATKTISAFQWKNAPEDGIAILEVISYSNDWILQRFTRLRGVPSTWTRCFHSGNTWGVWSSI